MHACLCRLRKCDPKLIILIAIAVGIHALETIVPKPLPWLRVGFSNAIVLTTLMLYGWRDALVVTVARTLLGNTVTGTILTPAPVIGLAGGIASLFLMTIAHGTHIFSPVGVSIVGALTHNLVQLLVVSVILGYFGVRMLIPIFILLSIVTGAITGVLAYYLYVFLKPRTETLDLDNRPG